MEEVREKVNELREELDGEQLEELDPGTPFRNDLESPTDRASASPIQSKQTKELLTKINEWFEEGVEQFLELDVKLRKKTEAVRSDEEALRALDVLELIQDGRQFLDEDADRCLLCLTDWDADELEAVLAEREEKASEANERMEELNHLQRDALPLLTEVRTAVDSLKNVLAQHEDFDTEELEDYLGELENYEEKL